MKLSDLSRLSGLKWAKQQWDGLPAWLRWLSPYIVLACTAAIMIIMAYIDVRKPRTVIILSGTGKGSAHAMGESLKVVLNTHINLNPASRSVLSGEYWKKHLCFESRETSGTRENIELLASDAGDPGNDREGGRGGKLAIIQDNLDLGRSNTPKSLLHLYRSYMHVIVDKKSGIRRLDQIGGANVYVGPGDGWTSRLFREKVLKFYGISLDKIVHEDKNQDEARHIMLGDKSDIDVAVLHVGLGTEIVDCLAASGRFDLLDVDRAETISLRFPHLAAASIPGSAYASRCPFPSRNVTTLSTSTILACNEGLDGDTVRRVLKTIHEHRAEIHPAIERRTAVVPGDPQRSFQFPLHPEALNFYKDIPPGLPSPSPSSPPSSPWSSGNWPISGRSS